MKRTCKLYRPERFEFGDGTVLERGEVTVEPHGRTMDGRRAVWADVDDDSCLYTLEAGLLWEYEGELL